MELRRLILLLFVLSFGKTPAALREFTQIQGEWIVVGEETGDKKVPVQAWEGQKVIFMSSDHMKKQPVNSMAYTGQIKLDHTPKLIEISTFSFMPEAPRHKETRWSSWDKRHPARHFTPIKRAEKSFAIYQVAADTMKLLLRPVTKSNTEPPKDFVTTKEGGEFLLELRRNLKKDSLSPEKPRRQPERSQSEK